MLEKILESAYDAFIETDSPELLDKKEEAVKKILDRKENLTENFVADRIGDVVCEAENIAFRAGFLACVDCFRALTGGEAK